MDSYMEQILFTGDLCSNGDDAIQAQFMKKFYKIHDRIFKTRQYQQYVNALTEIREKRESKNTNACQYPVVAILYLFKI